MKSWLIDARARLVGASLATLVLLASCGGSTRVELFRPERLVVIGDEHSLLDDAASPGNARKYTINATVSVTDPTLACLGNEIWVQVLATYYGLVFAQCNPDAKPVTARMHAALGAKVADIAGQIAQVGGFAPKDLVTVLAGANDIYEQYALYPGVPEAQLVAALEARGEALAAQVNVIADAGGKVLISTVPDLGLTPFALAEKAAHTDTDRAALLTRLTTRFNARLRANIYNDGRRVGLLLADELYQTLIKFPSVYGFTNVTSQACLSTSPVPSCTTSTLQPANGNTAAANVSTWMWADAKHLTPGGQWRLGSLAATRATNNPF